MNRWTHALKCWPGPFWDVKTVRKFAEFRKDDRTPPYEVGNYLELQEWVPDAADTSRGQYTGERILVEVTCVTRGYGIPHGYVMMSIRRIG